MGLVFCPDNVLYERIYLYGGPGTRVCRRVLGALVGDGRRSGQRDEFRPSWTPPEKKEPMK